MLNRYTLPGERHLAIHEGCLHRRQFPAQAMEFEFSALIARLRLCSCFGQRLCGFLLPLGFSYPEPCGLLGFPSRLGL